MSLWPHQQYTVEKFARTQRGLDLSDPGTGKTYAHLALYATRPHRGRMLVSCPKTLMRSAWGKDIDERLPQLSYSIADAKNRLTAFEADSDVVIINIDGVKDIVKRFPKAKDLRHFLREFDHLTIDEISFYKHGSSKRSKDMLKLSRLFEHRFGLSATPNPHSVTELWHPSLLIDDGKHLGTNFWRFRNAMQIAEQIGPAANMLEWSDKPQANEIVQIMLDDISVRHAFEEVMTAVPANHVDMKYITLPPKLYKQYRELEAHMVMLLESGTHLTVTHASSLRSKLLQLCSGAIYSGEDQYELLDPYRYELIADLIEEREHSVTFFNWRHQRDELIKNLNKRKIAFEYIDGSVTSDAKRAQIVEDYQAGKYQTLLINYKTGAHGLTLTRGTTSILCSPIYEADYFKQTIHRIYRGGQSQITNTLLVCAKGTVEELVYDKLRKATLRMEDFLQLVRESMG